MKRLSACAFLLLGLLSPAWADDQDDDAPNTGQDITKPVTRVDLRAGYQRTPGGANSWSFIARADKPFTLGGGWKLSLRADMPFINNTAGNGYRLGLGDALAQVLFINAIDKRQAFGFGAQIVAPTAGAQQFGTGRYQLIPTIGYRYALPEITPGSFFVGAVRYDFDFAGDPGRKHIRNLQFSPTLNVALPAQMFVTLYPSTDIRYNLVTRSWFVPFDIQFGKMWGKSVVTSLEFAAPIHSGASPLYKFKTEARLGIFF